MDDPRLCGLVLLVKMEDVGSGLDVMDDQRLSVLLGEQDVALEAVQLEIDGFFMVTVDAGFTNGNDFIVFQKGFKFLKIGVVIKPPGMDAEGKVIPVSVRMNVNERHF
jgi:hypothetical protein